MFAFLIYMILLNLVVFSGDNLLACKLSTSEEKWKFKQ